jgi:hypothetical protein
MMKLDYIETAGVGMFTSFAAASAHFNICNLFQSVLILC